MIRKGLIRQVFRFCTKDPIQQNQQKFLTDAQKKFTQVPIHLRPYDAAKYQVPAKKIKKNSGYAMVQIQPFPRARIMKICYNLLAQLKKGIPENEIFRIYNEERLKYIMELVDQEEDIDQLEKLFGMPSIQIFIDNLIRLFEVFEIYKKMELWKISKQEREQIDREMFNEAQGQDPKYPAYKKGPRVKSSII